MMNIPAWRLHRPAPRRTILEGCLK